MSKKKLIDAIEVKSPCSESWSEMRGNDRVRFCSHCAKDVNNLSEMTRRDALRLVRASGGNLCVRYTKHPKTNRPIFSGNLHQITRRAPRIAAGVITATVGLSAAAYSQVTPYRIPSQKIVRAKAITDGEFVPDKTANEPAKAEGGIAGTITGAAGEFVSSVTISAVNIESGRVWTASSSDIGFYELKGLTPGVYKLVFEARGFTTRDEQGISISSEVVSNHNVTMDAGVTVTSPAEVEVSGGIGFSLPNFEQPLSTAVQNDDLEEVKALISRGARVNVKEKYSSGIIPLFIAVENGSRSITEILIRFGAKVNARSTDRRTPLMMLDDDAEDGLVELLMQNGAKPDLTDKDGNTALILAAEAAETKTVKALIAAGASVNIQNNSGETALMKAADRDDLEMVRALILAGADVNLKNNDDETARDLASDDEVGELLESYGGHGGLPDDEEPADETGPGTSRMR